MEYQQTLELSLGTIIDDSVITCDENYRYDKKYFNKNFSNKNCSNKK